MQSQSFSGQNYYGRRSSYNICGKELTAAGICDMAIRRRGKMLFRQSLNKNPLKKFQTSHVEIRKWRCCNKPAEAIYLWTLINCLSRPPQPKLPMQKYRSALGAARRNPSIGMITSRGCPGQCTFCFQGCSVQIRFMSPLSS